MASVNDIPGLSCGVVCVILCLAVLVEHRLVTDRQTDTDTDGNRAVAYRASVVSRGKNYKNRTIVARVIAENVRDLF